MRGQVQAAGRAGAAWRAVEPSLASVSVMLTTRGGLDAREGHLLCEALHCPQLLCSHAPLWCRGHGGGDGKACRHKAHKRVGLRVTSRAVSLAAMRPTPRPGKVITGRLWTRATDKQALSTPVKMLSKAPGRGGWLHNR